MAALNERDLATADRPVRVVLVRMPAKKPALPKKRGGAKARRFGLVKSILKRRRTMIKLAIATVLAIALYVALGTILPFTGATALTVALLGTFGAFSYKGLLAIAAFGAVSKGMS